MQSEDDCDGYETTRYAFCIGDKEVGNITADMLGLSFFTKRGDMAVITLTVLTIYIAYSPWFNLTVMLSNTVEFMEVITSSTNQSDTWSTTFYCDCKLESHGICTSYYMATRALANLSYEGDKLAKRPRGHVITGLLQFESFC